MIANESHLTHQPASSQTPSSLPPSPQVMDTVFYRHSVAVMASSVRVSGGSDDKGVCLKSAESTSDSSPSGGTESDVS